MTVSISPIHLVPTAQAILTGAFAYSLIQSMRGRMQLQIAFERLVVALLALSLFPKAAQSLDGISNQLTLLVDQLGRDNLREFLLEAFKRAGESPGANGQSTSFNIPAVLEQAWRVGVWGAMNAIVEGTFLIVSFVLECAKEVLWTLLLFLFPLACGVFPVFPRMMTNLALYAVELSLWFPMLSLVERVTGLVAKQHVIQDGSWGLYLVAVQVVAILLILLIPSVTHRFLSGALSGDFNSQQGLFVVVRRVVNVTKPIRGGVA